MAGSPNRPTLLTALAPIRLPPLKVPLDLLAFDFGGNAMPAWPSLPPAPARPAQPPPPMAQDQDEESEAGEALPPAQKDSAEPAAPMAPAAPAAPAASAAGGSRGAAALAVARGEIGVAEDPRGSNRGPRVDQYQGGPKGQYWCAHFVSWCVEQGGRSPFGHLAAVSALRRWGQDSGAWFAAGTADPAPGDIFTMARRDKAGTIVGGHTGFVQSYRPQGREVRTVEGNVSDRVEERTRAVDALDGFIRI